MDANELSVVLKAGDEPQVSAQDMAAGGDRTLLYGYTCDRDNFHVYLEEGLIYRLVYRSGAVVSYQGREKWTIRELVPDKRAYPESTDYTFGLLAATYRIYIPYTAYDRHRAARVKAMQFHGSRFDEVE